MKTIIQHGGGSGDTCVVDEFNADMLGAPFKVILHNSVEVTYDKSGEVVDYNIPDIDGLLRAIVLRRVLHERKLSGPDIRFLRKCLNLKAKDVAKKIEVTPEHLSRCENKALVISPASEKLLRLFLFKTAVKLASYKSEEKKKKLEQALDVLFELVDPVAVYDANDELVLTLGRYFVAPRPANDEDMRQEPCWDAPKSAAL